MAGRNVPSRMIPSYTFNKTIKTLKQEYNLNETIMCMVSGGGEGDIL